MTKKIILKKLRHKNGKPVVIDRPKNIPKGFRAAARKSGREMRKALKADSDSDEPHNPALLRGR